MFSKSKSMVAVLAVLALMVVAVAGVSAEDDAAVPSISDGRVNGVDIAAPVAVFCEISYPYADDVNLGVLSGIELWGLTNTEDGEFHEVATVTADQLASVVSGAQVQLVQSFGYSLYANADGSFTVVAPADAEGKVYQFTWTPGENDNC